MNTLLSPRLKTLELIGQNNFGPQFKVHECEIDILEALMSYFCQDDFSESKYKLDIYKGLLIIGPVGIGKTTIMRLMARQVPVNQKFSLVNCRDISIQYGTDGVSVLQKYCKLNYDIPSLSNVCFDELGSEQNFSFYGNQCNIMAEILLSRYDRFVRYNHLTHLISNLNLDEIEIRYGRRVRSRLKEMVNLIYFPSDSKDKRS
ncbi:MAG: ATPase [Saprospiraceae bacterium]